MPSILVDDLWHEMLLHTRDYAAFCDAAFGRFLHHEPESAMAPAQALANRCERLLATLILARADEKCPPDALPLLFRVDHEAGLDGAHRYIADCGGRAQCYDTSTPHIVCLAHLAASGRPRPGPSQLPGRSHPNATPIGHNAPWAVHGCAGGCGGGGCGGCGS